MFVEGSRVHEAEARKVTLELSTASLHRVTVNAGRAQEILAGRELIA